MRLPALDSHVFYLYADGDGHQDAAVWQCWPFRFEAVYNSRDNGQRTHDRTAADLGRYIMVQLQKMIVWVLLAAFAVIITYLGFKGYLNPELLIHFSNSFYC